MKITYVPSDMDAPGFYRCLSPGQQLAKNGHTVQFPPYQVKERQDGTKGFEFQVDLPNPSADLWVLQSPRQRMWATDGVLKLFSDAAAVIADVDDNYEQLPEWNPAFYGTHPFRNAEGYIVNRAERRRVAKATHGAQGVAPNRINSTHMKTTFTRCDGVTVSTPYLKEIYSKWNHNIHVVRNFVDWEIWEDIEPQYKVERWQNRIRIGYLGVFRYRRGDLDQIATLIPKFLARHPEVDFVANSAAVHDYLNVPKRQRVVVKEYNFHPFDGGPYPVGRKTAHMDIGLVPLAPGGTNEGKSHLKGMEYNAAGIPFIASDTESYRYWTNPTRNGVIARSLGDWEEWLEHMVTEDDDRRQMGLHARTKAKQHSIQNTWPEWSLAYDRIMGDELSAYARGAIKRGAVQKVSELRSLLELVKGRDMRLVVEVGSARGGTYWALAQVASDDALLVSIDIPAGSPLDIQGGKDVYEGRDRERFRTFIREGQRCRLIDGDSQTQGTVNALKSVIDRPIDMLFIDADHRYQGVKRDYELYSPLVREGGIIAFHDVIIQNDRRSGVHLLWNEIKRKYPDHYEWVGKDNWGLGQWGGIGAIVKERSLVAA